MPEIGGGLELLLLRLPLPQVSLGRLPGGVEPVGAEADAADGVGEADGEQLPGPAADDDLPDPAAGFDEIGGPAPLHALFLGWLFHTFSVEAVRLSVQMNELLWRPVYGTGPVFSRIDRKGLVRGGRT